MLIYEFEGNAMFFEKVLAEYTKEKWQNCSSHVKKLGILKRDGLMDGAIDNIIIHF
jgi:hypothetical protein